MAKDRRCLHLVYPYSTNVRAHWCTPGLGQAMRQYIAERHNVQPKQVLRRRHLWMDVGGLAMVGRQVWVQMDGYRVGMWPNHLPVVHDLLRRRLERPPHEYQGVQWMRMGLVYNVALHPKEVHTLMLALAPHVASEATADALTRQQLVRSSHLLINTPHNPPPAEA